MAKAKLIRHLQIAAAVLIVVLAIGLYKAKTDAARTENHVRELQTQIDEREADIVRARFGLIDGRQQKLADIGKRHGISAERVRQLERQALATLRRIADPDLAA